MSEESTSALYRVEVRFGHDVLEDGFTPIPNIFLAHYARLGIDDSVAMFLIHIMRYKWTADNPYPRRDWLPMSCHEDTRRRYTRKLRNRGLLFTHRRYYTAETAPTPDLAGRQASLVYDLETLLHNLVRMKRWVDEGKPSSNFTIELPFGIVYKVVTNHFQDVPQSICVQCARHLGVSEDAVAVLARLAQLVDDRDPKLDIDRLVEKVEMAESRTAVAVEHLIEADLIICEQGQVRLLTDNEFTDRPALALVESPQSSGSGGANHPGRSGRANRPSRSGGTNHPGRSGGTDRPGRSSGANRPSGPGGTDHPGRDHPGRNHPGSFCPPLKEELVLEEESVSGEETEREEEKEASSCSFQLETILHSFDIRGRPCTEFVKADIEPAIVQAWIWWTSLRGMDRALMPGFVVERLRDYLRNGELPPPKFLALARALATLSDEEQAVLWRVSRACHIYGRRPSSADLPISVELWEVYHELFKEDIFPHFAAVDEAESEEPGFDDGGEPVTADEIPVSKPLLVLPPGVAALDDEWQRALGQLELQVIPANYDAWLRDTRLGTRDDAWVVVTPTAYGQEWLSNQMFGLIHKTLKSVTGETRELVIVAAAEPPATEGNLLRRSPPPRQLGRNAVSPGLRLDTMAG